MQFTTAHVRQYKGCPLAIVILLAMSRVPVGKEWLARNSGYTDKPVHQALEYLKEEGVVGHSRAGWFLANDVQLVLPGESRNISDSGSIISIESSELKELTIDSNSNNKGKFSDSLLSTRNNSDSRWSLLVQMGVRRNERTEAMLELPHMTEEYIAGMIEQYAREGKSTGWTGLFIKSLEAGEPVPEKDQDTGHFADCTCSKCAVARFLGR